MEDRQKFPYGGPKPVTQQAPIPVVKGSNTLVAPQREFDKRDPKHNFFLIGLMVAVLIGALVFYVGVKYRLSLNTQGEESIQISELKLCSFIDENYQCIPKETETYSLSQTVYVFFQIEDLNTRSAGNVYRISYEGDIDVYGPDTNLIEELEETNFFSTEKEVETGDQYIIPIKYEIATEQTDNSGTHRVVINVKDVYSKQEDKKEIQFNLIQ